MLVLIIRIPECCREKCNSFFPSVTANVALSKPVSLSISEVIARLLIVHLLLESKCEQFKVCLFF